MVAFDRWSAHNFCEKAEQTPKCTFNPQQSIAKFLQEEIADFLEQHEAGPLQASPAVTKNALEAREHPTSDDRPAKQCKISPEGASEFELSDNR